MNHCEGEREGRREGRREGGGGSKLVTLIQVVALELSTCRSGIACTCLKYGKHKPQSLRKLAES